MDGESDVPQPGGSVKVTNKSAEITSVLKELTEFTSSDKGVIPAPAEAEVIVARLEVTSNELKVSTCIDLFSGLIEIPVVLYDVMSSAF